MTVADEGEFGLLSKLTADLYRGEQVLLGPGDDAAQLGTPTGSVLVTADVLVEGEHFRRDWSSAADIGAKAATANLADIAAMGGRPSALLVSLVLPPATPSDWVQQLMTSLRDTAVESGASIIGGDVSSGPQVVVAVTAMGTPSDSGPVLRSGAQDGDVLAVAGQLGLSAAGHAVLQRGFRSPKTLVGAHRRPTPDLDAGPRAAAAGVHAMCDVSDGLLADAGHLARASGVGIDIDTATLPVPETMSDAASALGRNAMDWILGGGEDHVLLGCFPRRVPLPAGFVAIGSVQDGAPGIVTVDGEPTQTVAGWEHFRR